MPAVAKPKPSLQELIDNGFLEPVKRGRPAVYTNDEERRAAHKVQQKECMKRHLARIKEARARMLEGLNMSDVVPVSSCG